MSVENLVQLLAKQQKVSLVSDCSFTWASAQTGLPCVRWSQDACAYMWLHPKSPQSTWAPALTENAEEITSCWFAFGTAVSDSSWELLKFIYFLTLSTPNRLGREKPRMGTCLHRATKHLPRFFPAHISATKTSGEYHEAQHWQKACSDNVLLRTWTFVGALSTEENKNMLFPSRQDHCFKHVCWDSKDWHNLWQVLELWHHSHTETSPCTVRKQASFQTSILTIQTANATLMTQQGPDLRKWVLHRGDCCPWWTENLYHLQG